MNESNNVKKDKDAFTDNISKLNEDIEKIKAENFKLKNIVYKYTFSDKQTLVQKAEESYMDLFDTIENNQINKLDYINSDVYKKTQILRSSLNTYNVEVENHVSKTLFDTQNNLQRYISVAKEETLQGIQQEKKEAQDNYKELEHAPLPNDAIDKKIHKEKKNLEKFIGLNILNFLGIALISIGIFTASLMVYDKFGDLFKGIIIFLLGLLMLGAGEFLSKRNNNDTFSKGIISGGISILYIGIGVSYFWLQIIRTPVALIMCILITMATFFLAIHHNSQVIAIFALIGGQLPLAAITSSVPALSTIIYFLILNLLILFISFYKKWKVTSYIGLVLNLITTATISLLVHSSTQIHQKPFNFTITVLYLLISFVMYSIIPIISTYKLKTKFSISDIIFLSINTFFSAIYLFICFNSYGLYKYQGLLALGFAVIYYIIAKVCKSKFSAENKNISTLFFLTALAFSVLVTPLQFGMDFLAIGWLIEGVIVVIYGILANEKKVRNVGLIIFDLSIASFLLFDVLDFSIFGTDISLKYSFITVGFIAIMIANIFTKDFTSRFSKLIKHITIINFSIYAIYMLNNEIIYLFKDGAILNRDFPFYVLTLVVLLLTAFIPGKIEKTSDKITNTVSLIYYALTTIFGLYINIFISQTASSYHISFCNTDMNFAAYIITALELIALNLIMLFAIYNLLKHAKSAIKLQTGKIFISCLFIVVMIQVLMGRYDLDFSNITFSILFSIAAIAWIYFGFKNKQVIIRRMGLGLAIFSVVKLFVFDFYDLSKEYRIVAYLALGISLLLISYLYQKFTKKLELEEFNNKKNDNMQHQYAATHSKEENTLPSNNADNYSQNNVNLKKDEDNETYPPQSDANNTSYSN